MNLLQIFVLILPFVLVSGYDDLRSRQLFSMSAAGLAADPTICMKKTFPDTNWSLIKTETAFDVLYKMNITVFAIINHDEKKIIISFAVDEPDDEKKIEQMFKTSKPVEFHNFGNVQSIFFELEEQVWDGVHAIVAAENYLEYSTTFTGYSFGGAIATLAAMRTIARGFRTSEKIELYTFGEPRVGTLVFANSVDREIPQKFRITHSGDPIVHMPKCIQKGEFSCSINEPNGPIHHGTEIFYDNDMKFGANYLKCTLKDEDENCANKKINQLDFKNHQYYFQHKVKSFGKFDCTDVEGVDNSSTTKYLNLNFFGLVFLSFVFLKHFE